MNELFFSDLLRQVGIEPAKVKLIRHSVSNANFRACLEAGFIYEYTCHQRLNFGKDFEYWAVFISDEGTRAYFYALYKCNGILGSDTREMIPDGYPEIEAIKYNGENACYSLEKSDLLRNYEGSLVIDWGNAPEVWHQRGDLEKRIVKINSDAKRNNNATDDELLIRTDSKKGRANDLVLR